MRVYRFGKGTPVIYIDNRLLQDNSELQRLSAADIEKVELITNPGAEYDATVKAVVRIRTVRNKETVLAVISVQESPNGDAAAITDKSI